MPNRKTAKTRKLRRGINPKVYPLRAEPFQADFYSQKTPVLRKERTLFAIRLFLGVFYDFVNIITLRQQLLFPLARLFL